jgi:hypothetical protein
MDNIKCYDNLIIGKSNEEKIYVWNTDNATINSLNRNKNSYFYNSGFDDIFFACSNNEQNIVLITQGHPNTEICLYDKQTSVISMIDTAICFLNNSMIFNYRTKELVLLSSNEKKHFQLRFDTIFYSVSEYDEFRKEYSLGRDVFWDSKTTKEGIVLAYYTPRPSDIKATKEDKFIISGDDRNIYVFNMEGELLKTFLSDDYSNEFDISYNGEKFAMGTLHTSPPSGTATLISLKDYSISNRIADVQCLRFSPTDDFFIYSSNDELYKVDGKGNIVKIDNILVRVFAFLPNGYEIVCSDIKNENIFVYNLKYNKITSLFNTNINQDPLAFSDKKIFVSPNGKYLLFQYGSDIYIYSIEMKTHLGTINMYCSRDKFCEYNVNFSPDNKFIITTDIKHNRTYFYPIMKKLWTENPTILYKQAKKEAGIE